jgi:hypothetical protein
MHPSSEQTSDLIGNLFTPLFCSFIDREFEVGSEHRDIVFNGFIDN